MENSAYKGKIVLGVIGYDAHVIGNRILEYALKQEGYKVVNLGIFNTQEDFVNAALEADADAILVGSLYGHAELDCQGLKEKCIESGLDKVLLYIGGNLAIGEKQWDLVYESFSNLGFDRVFPLETLPKDVIDALNSDLANLSK